MPFKYDKTADQDWLCIPIKNGNPVSRAGIQDYARCTNRSPDDWVNDALVWFMHECDRQGAHGSQNYLFPKVERKRVAPWRTKLADRLYGLADSVAGLEDQ